MERKCLHIGKPALLTEEDKAILRAEIDDDGRKKTLEFKTDAQMGEYLTWERSDAFLVGLLYYAMVMGRDVEWETPCNEQLVYQLQTYYVPICAQEMAFMHDIELRGPTTSELLPCEHAVATGLSNGVDSTYTVHKYLSYKDPEQRLTHVVTTDWFVTAFSKEFRDDFMNKEVPLLRKCTEELGLKFIYVEFHPDAQFSIGIINDKACGTISDAGLHPLKYCSVAFALQKLIGVYYFSSGFSPSGFTFHETDFSHHDLLTLPLISTKSISFYSSGVETTRINKVASFADWPYAQKHLQVCVENPGKNCGCCFKCIRGMGELYANGKLELFQDVFPIDDFKKHLPQRLGYILGRAQSGNILFRDVIEKTRENGIPIPAMSYILSPYYRLKEYARVKLRVMPWARRIYHLLHLDRVLHKNKEYYMSGYMDEMILGKNNGFTEQDTNE